MTASNYGSSGLDYAALLNNPQVQAALKQLTQTQGQLAQGQQQTGIGQTQLASALRNLNAPTSQVGGVAGRTSPFQALGNGLMGGAGLSRQVSGAANTAQGYQNQEQGIGALIAALRGQNAQSGGDLDPGAGVSADAANEAYGALGD